MVDTKISAAAPVAGAGALFRPAAVAGSTTAYHTTDNLYAVADPATTNDNTQGYHPGSVWYRPDTLERWICSDATTNAAVWNPDWGQINGPRKRFYSFTDCTSFVLGTSVFGDWAIGTSGSGSGAIADVSIGAFNAVGIVSFPLGTVAGARAFIGPNNGSVVGVKLGSGRARFQSRLAVHQLSNGTDTYVARSGFIDAMTGESTDGCFFRYTDGVNAGKWQAVCRSNGTETTVDTGVTPVADTFQRFLVDVNAAGASTTFYIDGALVATITTNIPTGAGRETGYGVELNRTLGTAAANGVYVDFCEVDYTFTAAR